MSTPSQSSIFERVGFFWVSNLSYVHFWGESSPRSGHRAGNTATLTCMRIPRAGRRPVCLALFFGAVLIAQQPADTTGAGAEGGWRPLFDGKSLAGWRESDFFGAGKVAVENGSIQIGFGALTGINWSDARAPFPTSNYEVRVEVSKVKGSDFFAGVTFPAGDSYCTWINGGWGGEVVGLSSINGADAAHNETTFSRKFEPGRWYTLRLRVTSTAIAAWIDDELAFEVGIRGKAIALREGEIEHSIPFGIAAYSTVAAVRKIEWRPAEPANERLYSPKDR
jgi:hypothetical protein